MPDEWVTGFTTLIVAGYIAMMVRCNKNLDTVKKRLKTTIKDKFPVSRSICLSDRTFPTLERSWDFRHECTVWSFKRCAGTRQQGRKISRMLSSTRER